MRWHLRRRPRQEDDAEKRETTLGDVGRGLYGPDPKEQPVWRFGRTRLPSKGSRTAREA
jgi:hypothetical protein